MSIFIDTGAFYALADASDKYHESAKRFYLNAYKPSAFITSDYVFIESWTLIHHKLGKAAAKNFWQRIRSNIVPLERVSAVDLEHAWKIFGEYEDQDFSLVDCTSFALMERLQTTEAFAFDSHFSMYRTSRGMHIQVYPPSSTV